MNAKLRAKRPLPPLLALVVAAFLVAGDGRADDGNLSQQLRVQQNKSRFQLMLEQVEQRARLRARQRAQRAPSTRPGEGVTAPTNLGDWTQSVRLDPVSVTEPQTSDREAHSSRRLRTEQAYERDQRNTLDQRQKRSALVADTRRGSRSGAGGFSAKRRELSLYNTQNQRLSLQRKLRR